MYCLTIVHLDTTEYVKKTYSLMYRHVYNNPAHTSWARNVNTCHWQGMLTHVIGKEC